MLYPVLPGAFNTAKDPADRTDVQGIIQRQFFGEKTITGNGRFCIGPETGSPADNAQNNVRRGPTRCLAIRIAKLCTVQGRWQGC